MSIKVIAFDLFGTVFDPSTVDEHDCKIYIHAIKHWRAYRQYMPVSPRSIESFTRMQPYADSKQGIDWLREKGFITVAASNIPSCVSQSASFFPNLKWDLVMDYERMKIYKPDLAAYAAICDATKCLPNEVLFVTGNHGPFGIGDDIEPLKIGMQTAKIRRDSPIQTIIDLAATLKPTG